MNETLAEAWDKYRRLLIPAPKTPEEEKTHPAVVAEAKKEFYAGALSTLERPVRETRRAYMVGAWTVLMQRDLRPEALKQMLIECKIFQEELRERK